MKRVIIFFRNAIVFFVRIYVLLTLFLIMATETPKFMYETLLIKKQFAESGATIIKMVQQSDFGAKYDVYFTSANGVDFLITQVMVDNKKIDFYNVYKLLENLERGDKVKITPPKNLYAALEEINKLYE